MERTSIFKLLLPLFAEPIRSDLFPHGAVLMDVRKIGNWGELFDVDFVAFQDVVVCMHGNDFGNEQVVRAEIENLFYLAFKVQRAFIDERRLDYIRLRRCEPDGQKFVRIFAGYGTAVVRFLQPLLRWYVHDEFQRFLHQTVSVSRRSDGDADHGRVRTEHPSPGDGCDIRFAVLVVRTDEHDRRRIKIGGRLKTLLRHRTSCEKYERKRKCTG